MRKPLSAAVVSIAVTALGASQAHADPLMITPSTDAAALVAALVAGSGLTVIAGSEQLLGGGLGSAGTFTGGTGIIPFDSGVLLTTGTAAAAAGPNTSDSFSQDSGGGSDPDLEVLNGASTVFNATVLQFSFTAPKPDISFQYVFGSEEYNEFVGSGFNDVFGFFLNGVNIALLPGAGGVVSINNVNCASNPNYYTNNDNSTPAGSGDATCIANGKPNAMLNTQYDGLVGAGTNAAFWLYASGLVVPGAVNTIKLAIGDSNDSAYDSGVFLKAILNEPPPPPVPEPAGLALVGLVLVAARRLRARRTP